jgi:DNA-binding Xre family transcriptional regulator
MQTHWKLDATLRRFRKSPLALVRVTGLAKTTVYNIINNKAKAVEVETLDKLVAGLEQLTGETMRISDVIEREPRRNPLLEELIRDARPFDWNEVQQLIPQWTLEEQQENEAFVRELEGMRVRDLEAQRARDLELDALFAAPKKRKGGRS